MRYQIISVLIGLANATNNNPKSENTDNVVLTAMRDFASLKDADKGEEAVEKVQAVIAAIRAEKHAVSPGCATCQTPCGNTSDYDLSGITEAEPELKELKISVLDQAATLATRLLAARKKLPDDGEYDVQEKDVALVYKSLSYVGWNLNADSYKNLIKEFIKMLL